MEDEFKPEFCREVVAVLVGAIIASVIDPMPDDSDTHPQLASLFEKASPDDLRVAAALASLMSHLEVRVGSLQEHGMPEHLANQYRNLIDLLEQTAAYQLLFPSRKGQTLQ